MSYENLQHLDGSMVVSLTTTLDGKPVAGMTMDREILLQIFKGIGPAVTKMINELETKYCLFDLDEPIESISGPAVDVARSHDENRLVLDSDKKRVGLYVRSAVAEIMIKKGLLLPI